MIDFDRLEKDNKPLNAFTSFDRAAQFGSGKLAGLTVGIKDNIAVQGMKWTAGMGLRRDRIAKEDADVVRALRNEGAAIIGMLNMEEAALGAKTDNPFYGATQNPHKIGFTPGGSSGGSGASVAAGLCDIALGTDTMGSVRIPASYCGVYGFKPAQSAVSQNGLEFAERTLDVIGPLARSLDLLEISAKIISEFGDGSLTAPAATLDNLGGVECDEDVLRIFGHVLELMDGPIPFTLEDDVSRIRYAGFIATADELTKSCEGAPEGSLSPRLSKLISYGPKRKPEGRLEDTAVLARTKTQLNEILAKHSVILLPTAPQPAFDHKEDAPANQADFTCLANIADLPAISIPAGWSKDGLPIGIQIIGARDREAQLFAVARELDEQLQAYHKPEYFA